MTQPHAPRDRIQMFEELSDIFSDHNNHLTSRELLMKVRGPVGETLNSHQEQSLVLGSPSLGTGAHGELAQAWGTKHRGVPLIGRNSWTWSGVQDDDAWCLSYPPQLKVDSVGPMGGPGPAAPPLPSAHISYQA